MPLCSILIPSRWRFEALLVAVQSWYEHTKTLDNFEILIRLHATDPESISRQSELTSFGPQVKVFTGRDKVRPEANNWLWNQLLPYARGTWHQYWSDDMRIFDSGTHWDELLAPVPTLGFIVQPEIHRLNNNSYPAHDGGPVPFVPAAALQLFGFDAIPEPPDTSLDQILRVKHGWTTYFLKGVGVFHDRNEQDRTLQEY